MENKKVLVIHPFEKSIRAQYAKREFLHENPHILPKFELKTIKAVQSIAGTKTEFATWFDALESMKQQIDKTDFDIALIGCGAYGLPLAAYTKSLGKQAVHIGGALQLMFGIKGKRWAEWYPGMFNKYWVSPDESETPQNYTTIEGGCYW